MALGFVSLPHSAFNLYVVCDCGNSWSYSLTFWFFQSTLYFIGTYLLISSWFLGNCFMSNYCMCDGVAFCSVIRVI